MPYSGFYTGLLKYYLFSRHKYGYGIHSPFVYGIVKDLFKRNYVNKETHRVEEIRKELKKSGKWINYSDYGSKSDRNNDKQNKISTIISKSAIKKKYGELLFQLVRKFKPGNIMELGTSFGMSTMYMAIAGPDVKINTIEGCVEKAKIAERNFNKLNLKNIKLSKGKFDDVLPGIINRTGKLDMVFFDGNHRREPTLRYFDICLTKAHEGSVFIFDDINWSSEMKQAWQEIKLNRKVSVTIDLFFMGLVFFKNDCAKQNYVIRY